MTTPAIERSIWIDVPIRRVWRALTDPNQIAAWFSPGATWRMTAYEIGARLSLEDPRTGEVVYTEVIDLLETPYRLCLRAVGDCANAGTVTTYALAVVSGGTLLSVGYANNDTPPDNTGLMDEDCPGVYVALENVRALCEETPLPYPDGLAFEYALGDVK